MNVKKESLMYILKLLRAGYEWPYRKTFFTELETLTKLTKSAGVSLYWADVEEQKLYAKENLDEYITCNIPIAQDGHVSGVTAFFKQIYVIDDVNNLPEIWNNIIIDYTEATSVLCSPILDSFNDCIGVLELYKNDDTTYTEEIIEYVKIVTGWVGVILQQSVNFTRFRYINDKCAKVLMHLSEHMVETINFRELMSKFSPIITSVLGAETIILYEMDIFSTVQVYYGTPLKYKRIKEFNATNVFVKEVLSNNKSLRVYLEPDDPRIKNNAFLNALPKIESLYCLPLLADNNILGVIILVNVKCDDQHELQILDYLLKYLVVALQFKRLYDSYSYQKAKKDILMKRLYHQAHRNQDVNEIFRYNIEEEDVGEFYFYPKKFDNIVPMVIHMIKSLCNELVDDKTLRQYVVAVLRCHRQDLPFHNVFQSCDSTNAMYVVLIRNAQFFKPYELLVLLIAAFLFSIDHFGLSNFLIEYIKHPLSIVYYNFYKERNRYELGKFLIMKTGLLSHLPQVQQEQIMRLYTNVMNLEKKYNIPSRRDKFIHVLKGKRSEDLSKSQRSHIMEFLVWCCYHCRHTNVYKVSKTLTDKIYEEYYRNGDILIRRNLRPKRRQNRQYAAQVLTFEIDYINHVLLPGYKILMEIFPCTQPIYDSAMALMKNYQDAIDLEGRSVWKPGVSIGLIKESI